jgi:palmitoyltransferase ZDHHC9/14/18
MRLKQTLTLILVIVTAALHPVIVSRRKGVSFGKALQESIGSAVVFCLAMAVVWPIIALLSYHMRVSAIPTVKFFHDD